MKKNIIAALVGLIATVGLIMSGVLAVNAQADPGPQVCNGTHLFDATGPTHTYTAPDGMLVAGYCVKAGSVQQGNGPQYVVVDPPTKTVTISHSSGKDISHYAVTLVPEDGKPTETPTKPVEEPTTEPPVTHPPVTGTPVILDPPSHYPPPSPPITGDIGEPEVEVSCSAHKCTKTTKNSQTGEIIEHEETVYPLTAEEEGL